MTWQEAVELLDTQTAASALEFARRPEYSSVYRAPSPSGEEYTDAQIAEGNRACLAFVADLSWPQGLSDHTMRECLSRLSQAAALARFVVEAGARLPQSHAAILQDFPDALLLRWLLIDYWHMAGMWREIYRLSSL